MLCSLKSFLFGMYVSPYAKGIKLNSFRVIYTLLIMPEWRFPCLDGQKIAEHTLLNNQTDNAYDFEDVCLMKDLSNVYEEGSPKIG